MDMKNFRCLVLSVAVGVFCGSAFAASLADTGGYVPSGEPALAFEGVALAELGTKYIPTGRMNGGYLTSKEGVISWFARSVAAEGGAVRYQAQYVDGEYLKCVLVEFTQGEGGIYAKALSGYYTSTLTDFGADISGANVQVVATADDEAGYGVHRLGLVETAAMESISVNFYHGSGKLSGTGEAGADAYSVNIAGWSQMQGSDNNTLSALSFAGSDSGMTFFAVGAGASAKITGTRGTWSYGGYAAASDVRAGYIDDDENNTTPTMTISNVPFEFYKVVVYASTDTENARFGHVAVNGYAFTSGNSGMDETQAYATVEGRAAWGKSRVSDYLEGVNYLVTPVLPATSDGTVTIVGHKQGGRGCIAAAQIFNVEYPVFKTKEISAGEINGVVASGADSFVKVPDGAVITLDEELAASKIRFACEGTLTLSAPSQPGAEELAKLDFKYVKGAVLRSWLTPGVVGFNFNSANGADTSKALVAGDWHGDESGKDGVSTALSPDGISVLTWTSATLWNAGTQSLTDGYLDDGANGGDGAFVTLTAVPYETYDVVIYASTDSGTSFTAKTVNGVAYTWDDAAQRAVAGSASWGAPGYVSPIYGINALRISGLSGPLTISGGAKSGDARGGIAAFQIMPHDAEDIASSCELALDGAAVAWSSGEWKSGGVGVDAPVSGDVALNIEESTMLEIDTPLAIDTMTVDAQKDDAAVEIACAANVPFRVREIAIAGGVLRQGSSDLFANVGAVKVNAGATLDIGTHRAQAEFDFDGGILAVRLARATEIVSLRVANAPAKVVLSDVEGNSIEATAVRFADGVLSIYPNLPLLNAGGETAFDDETAWKNGVMPGEGESAVVALSGDAHVSVSGRYTLGDVVFEGAGDATIPGEGSIAATSLDFSLATGKVDYKLPAGDAFITAGADTIVSGGGYGSFSVAGGRKLTLGAWGDTQDGVTYDFQNGGSNLAPGVGATVAFSPGEGKIQKTKAFTNYDSSTKIVVTNGTYLVNSDGGGAGFFGGNSVVVERGGVLSLEDAIDLTGYDNTTPTLTINGGGTLQVKMRDTLRRPLVLNGGTVSVQGADGGRALDFYKNNVVTVHADSTIQAVATDGVPDPKIWIRDDDGNGDATVVNIDDGVTFANNVTYESAGGLTVQGTMNTGNGTGVMVMNGFEGNPIAFAGTATIGTRGKPVIYELNCEHRGGKYVVNAGSRLRGSGSVTGAASSVTLAAANAKFCGLEIENLVAVNGATYGDQWNVADAKVTGKFEAKGTHTVDFGKFTIAKTAKFYETVVETVEMEDGEVATTNVVETASLPAAFVVNANGNLALERNVILHSLAVQDGGTLTFSAVRSKSVASLATQSGSVNFAGRVNIVLDFGDGIAAGKNYNVLTFPSSVNLDNVTFAVSDNSSSREWVCEVVADEENGLATLRCSTRGGFTVRVR